MFDLNDLTPEEIVELGYVLEDEMEKEASEYDFDEDELDLNALSPDEIVELGYLLEDEMEKEASEVYYDDEDDFFDLNDFSVDEFVELAASLEEEMEKEAMMSRGGRAVRRMRGKSSMKDRAQYAMEGASKRVRGARKKATKAGRRYKKSVSSRSREAQYGSGVMGRGRAMAGRKSGSRLQRAGRMGRAFSPEISAAGAGLGAASYTYNR